MSSYPTTPSGPSRLAGSPPAAAAPPTSYRTPTSPPTSKPRKPSPLSSRSNSFVGSLPGQDEANNSDSEAEEQDGKGAGRRESNGQKEKDGGEVKHIEQVGGVKALERGMDNSQRGEKSPVGLGEPLSATAAVPSPKPQSKPAFTPTLTTTSHTTSHAHAAPQPHFPRSTRLLPARLGSFTPTAHGLSSHGLSSSPRLSSLSANTKSSSSGGKPQQRTKIIQPTKGKTFGSGGWMQTGCFELGLTQQELARND